MAFGAIVPILMAAAKRKREEEDMSNYGQNDLDGWEFKIVRSPSGRFNNYERVQALCKEEENAGGEMLEKMDEYRIRFKRKTEKRAGDSRLKMDPYRTVVGLSEFGLALCIIAIIFAIIGTAIATVWISTEHNRGFGLPLLIPIIMILLGVMALFVIRLKK
jgi:hypothetical protein